MTVLGSSFKRKVKKIKNNNRCSSGTTPLPVGLFGDQDYKTIMKILNIVTGLGSPLADASEYVYADTKVIELDLKSLARLLIGDTDFSDSPGLETVTRSIGTGTDMVTVGVLFAEIECSKLKSDTHRHKIVFRFKMGIVNQDNEFELIGAPVRLTAMERASKKMRLVGYIYIIFRMRTLYTFFK